MEDIEDKLAKLPSKAFATETNNDFTATFLHSADLLSWYKMKDMFPDARDVEEQVKGGWNAKKIAVQEWDTNGDYNAIQILKDIAKRDEVQVYTVRGFEGRFEVFVFSKMMLSSASKQWASQDRQSRFAVSRIHFEDNKPFQM